jgi:nucleoside diphosphate kinase
LIATFFIPLSAFTYCQERCLKLTTEQVENFFMHRKDNIELEVQEWTSGSLIVLCLSRENAVELWKELMGPKNVIIAKQKCPTCLRALYGVADNQNANVKNAVHGSNCANDAFYELHYFFPHCKIYFRCKTKSIYTFDYILSNSSATRIFSNRCMEGSELFEWERS